MKLNAETKKLFSDVQLKALERAEIAGLSDNALGILMSLKTYPNGMAFPLYSAGNINSLTDAVIRFGEDSDEVKLLTMKNDIDFPLWPDKYISPIFEALSKGYSPEIFLRFTPAMSPFGDSPDILSSFPAESPYSFETFRSFLNLMINENRDSSEISACLDKLFQKEHVSVDCFPSEPTCLFIRDNTLHYDLLRQKAVNKLKGNDFPNRFIDFFTQKTQHGGFLVDYEQTERQCRYLTDAPKELKDIFDLKDADGKYIYPVAFCNVLAKAYTMSEDIDKTMQIAATDEAGRRLLSFTAAIEAVNVLMYDSERFESYIESFTNINPSIDDTER